jgi:hypothetical protein
MYLPIATPPVKVTRSTAGLRDQLVGDLARVARDHAQHLGRQAGLVQDVGEQQADSGTFSDGLSTMRLLVAMPGTTLCATWFIGWLKGVMAVITPSSGSRCVYTRGAGGRAA